MIEGEKLDLNFRQMVALIDLRTGYTGPDWSPAMDKRTRNALVRRQMWSEIHEQVTGRGLAYLAGVEFDVGWFTRRRSHKARRRARLKAA